MCESQEEHGISSYVIDHSCEAVDLSSMLITKLEQEKIIPKDSVIVRQSKAEEFDYFGHQVIFIAALAGETPEDKRSIFQKIKNGARSNTHILARSSRGNRQLLYPPIPQVVYEDFDLLYEVHPHNDIINSTVLLRR